MADDTQRSIHLLHDPLDFMRIRADCSPKHKFGRVRRNNTRVHQGWDLEAKVNTPIYAVSDGTIDHVSNIDAGDYGKQIRLKFFYGPKTYYAFYAHLSHVSVKQGDAVKQGDEIGRTGKTGNASNLAESEEHLHFEIRTEPTPGLGLGGRVDPATMFSGRAPCTPRYEQGGSLGTKQDAAFNF